MPATCHAVVGGARRDGREHGRAWAGTELGRGGHGRGRSSRRGRSSGEAGGSPSPLRPRRAGLACQDAAEDGHGHVRGRPRRPRAGTGRGRAGTGGAGGHRAGAAGRVATGEAGMGGGSAAPTATGGAGGHERGRRPRAGAATGGAAPARSVTERVRVRTSGAGAGRVGTRARRARPRAGPEPAARATGGRTWPRALPARTPPSSSPEHGRGRAELVVLCCFLTK
nr:uncharacterized protein LOC127339856 [Lolium perenne]